MWQPSELSHTQEVDHVQRDRPYITSAKMQLVGRGGQMLTWGKKKIKEKKDTFCNWKVVRFYNFPIMQKNIEVIYGWFLRWRVAMSWDLKGIPTHKHISHFIPVLLYAFGQITNYIFGSLHIIVRWVMEFLTQGCWIRLISPIKWMCLQEIGLFCKLT